MIEKIKKIFKDNIYLIILIIAILIIYNKWIFNIGIITHGDMPFFFKETMSTIRINCFSTWLSDISFGRILVDLGQAPTYSMFGIMSKFLNFPFQISERIIYLLPIIFLIPLFSYLLLKEYFEDKLSALIGSIVYSFNTYFLFSASGHLTLLVSFGIAPLIFYFYERLIKTGKNKYLIWVILVAFLSSSYEPRAFYIIYFIFIFYNIFLLFIKENIYKKKIIFNFLIITFVKFLINFYWIISLIVSKSLVHNFLFDRGIFFNGSFNILESLSLHHPWWNGSITTFITQPIPFYFWFIPIFAIFSIIFYKNNKYIVFFSIITLLGILLSKQSDHPFIGLYTYLFNNFPGFNAFREGSKFYFIIALGFSVLIAGFVCYIKKVFNKNNSQKIFIILLILLILSASLWDTREIITGEIGRLTVQRHIPSDYLILKDKILSENEYFRTFWTPKYSRWSVYTDLHPEVSNVDIIQSNWQFLINYTFQQNWPQNKQMIEILKQNYSDNLLDVSSIKYVLVPLRDTANDDDFFVNYGNSSEFYIDILNNQTYLKNINIGTKEVKIYENENYLGHIYISEFNQSLDNFNRSQISNINYQYINPTEYKIRFNQTEPFYLYFSEAYQSQWKLAENFKRYKGFSEKNYIFDDNHFESYGFLNGWYIDPSKLEKDSNGEYELTIYFKPQSYFYLGLIISGITSIICILYLIYYYTKNRKAKKEQKSLNL